jgi:hypothetical protein
LFTDIVDFEADPADTTDRVTLFLPVSTLIGYTGGPICSLNASCNSAPPSSSPVFRFSAIRADDIFSGIISGSLTPAAVPGSIAGAGLPGLAVSERRSSHVVAQEAEGASKSLRLACAFDIARSK